jgi:hypothetical protein
MHSAIASHGSWRRAIGDDELRVWLLVCSGGSRMLSCGARIKLDRFLRHDPVLYTTHNHPNNLIFAQSETARYYHDAPQARDSCIFLLHTLLYPYSLLHLYLLFPQSLIILPPATWQLLELLLPPPTTAPNASTRPHSQPWPTPQRNIPSSRPATACRPTAPLFART